MKLKRLSLQGYKTFAAKTEFLFDEGITAVVGPNGSGKSNIADALRWVLGEQSYSSLRGKRTTDMIFAGSQTRPRSGMAQVTLVLDNTDGWLPIDYAEVGITRRAHRTGENEYVINGQKVRLTDVLDLLATSGLAQRTYTIIGQGLIDRALSLRAEERRALFEEAAGINHYKVRRTATLRRLKETQHNLERVNDILAEIRPRLNSLKRQATRAQNHEQIAQDLHHLLRIWYGFKWEKGKENLRLARATAVAAEKSWSTSRHTLLVQQENIDDVQHHINRTQQKLAQIRNERDTIREQLEEARREVAVLQERQQATVRQLTEIEQERPLLEQQQTTAVAELKSATTELAEAQANMQSQQSELRQFNSIFENKQAEITQWQTRLRQGQQEQRGIQTKVAQAEGQLSQLKERHHENNAAQITKDNQEIERLEATIQAQTAILTTAKTTQDEQRQKIRTLRQQRQNGINALKQARRAINEQERNLNKQRSQVARLETRVEMLGQQRHKKVKLPKNVQLVGQLATLITIPETHRPALETALSARLATLVVNNAQDLWTLLAENPKQAFTALTLADVNPAPQIAAPPGTAWANSVVTAKSNISPAVDLLLGGILLVKDQQQAYQLAANLPPGTMAATPDGLLVHAGGLVEAFGDQAQTGILARENAWREARESWQQRQNELAEMETAVATQRQKIDQQQAEVDTQQNEEQRLIRLENESNQRFTKAQNSLDRARQQANFLKRQQDNRARDTERRKVRVAEIEQALVGYRATAVALESSVSTATTKLAALPVAEAQQQRQALQQSIASAQTIVAGRQAVVDSRRSTLNQVEQQLTRLVKRQEALQAQQKQQATNSHEDTRLKLQEQIERLDQEITPLRQRLTALRDELLKLQEKTTKHQRHAHELENQYTQTKIRLTQQENQIEGLQERIKADLGLVALRYDEEQTGATPLPMAEVVEELPQVSELPADIEKTIQNYRGQLQRMGAINPDAPVEYEETATRYEFLSQQIEDLTKTDAQLREIIAELDDLTSKAFAETVDKVNHVFGDTFTQLFDGGSARLVLTDPDDLTVSGVDIVARLPNRREQGLALLSGGERSLTASALIFSLLKVSPTPFCVMDEVDAALDEANINRFRELLRELSLKTQFVVITHNRGTVQAADTIYGISMQPDSTSQVISIKPEEYTKQSLL